MSAPARVSPALLAKGGSTFDQRLAKLAGDEQLGLAPLLGVEREHRAHRLYPYWVRRDVGALLVWAGQLKARPQAAYVSPVAESGHTRIVMSGHLLGELVDLVVCTHRTVPGPESGTVSWGVLSAVADAELADLDPVLTDAVLPDVAEHGVLGAGVAS